MDGMGNQKPTVILRISWFRKRIRGVGDGSVTTHKARLFYVVFMNFRVSSAKQSSLSQTRLVHHGPVLHPPTAASKEQTYATPPKSIPMFNVFFANAEDHQGIWPTEINCILFVKNLVNPSWSIDPFPWGSPNSIISGARNAKTLLEPCKSRTR